MTTLIYPLCHKNQVYAKQGKESHPNYVELTSLGLNIEVSSFLNEKSHCFQELSKSLIHGRRAISSDMSKHSKHQRCHSILYNIGKRVHVGGKGGRSSAFGPP